MPTSAPPPMVSPSTYAARKAAARTYAFVMIDRQVGQEG